MTTINITYAGHEYQLTDMSGEITLSGDGKTFRKDDKVIDTEIAPNGFEIIGYSETAGAIVSTWQRAVFADTRVDPDVNGIIARFLDRKSTPWWLKEEYLD